MKLFSWLLVWPLVLLVGCSHGEIEVAERSKIEKEIDQAALDVLKQDCSVEKTKEVTVNQGVVSLPTRGFFWPMSHYVTAEDRLGQAAFPKNTKEDIKDHLDMSCDYLRSLEIIFEQCTDVYGDKGAMRWAPARGGKAGMTAMGDRRPSVEQEVWLASMHWKIKNKPRPGTKYLIKREDGKAVVVSVGYEIGPINAKYLGGVSREVHWFLESRGGSVLTIGKLKSQYLPYGPVLCK